MSLPWAVSFWFFADLFATSSSTLTDFVGLIVFDDLGEFHVPSYDGDLIGRLISVVQTVLLGASEQQLANARRVGVVDGAHVQRRVPRRVTGVHVRAVEQQVIQVLDQIVAAGLKIRTFFLILCDLS